MCVLRVSWQLDCQTGGFFVKTVMIVDDSQFMCSALRNIMEFQGYSVVREAKSGLEAILSYRLHRPSLVTMDITLPGMSGIDATKTILEIDPLATVVVVSSMGQERIIMDALRVGAKGFVTKPFSVKTVMDEIERCVNLD